MTENEITQIGGDLTSDSSVLLTAVGDTENTTLPAGSENRTTDPPVPIPAFNNISIDMVPYAPQSTTPFAKVMSIKVSAEGEKVENFALYDDGTMIAKNAQIAGIITAKGGKIGGWSISTNAIYNNSYRNGNSSKFVGMLYSTNSNDIAFGAGDFSSAGQCFYVTHNGNLYANNATIAGTVYASAGVFTGTVHAKSGEFTGTITANSGSIGGWTINSNYIAKGDVKLGENGGGMTFGSNLTITNEGNIDAKSLTLNGDIADNIEKVHLSSSTFERQINGYGTINDLLIAFNAYEDNTGTSNSAFAVAASGRVFCKEVLFNAVEVEQNIGHYTQSFYIAQHDSNFGLYIDTIATSSASTPTTDPYKPTQITTGRTGIYCATDLVNGEPAYCFPRILYTRQGIQAHTMMSGVEYRTIQNYEIVKNEIMTPALLGLVDNNIVYKFKIASSGGGTAGYITFIV